MRRFTTATHTDNFKHPSSVGPGVHRSGYFNGEASNTHFTSSLAAVLKRATGAIRPTAMALLLAALSLTAACGSGGGGTSDAVGGSASGGGGGTVSSGGGAGGTTAPPAAISTAAVFTCTFASSPIECGLQEQAKVAGRGTLVNFGRSGATAVRLHTEPGDNNVVGSGDLERDDLWLSQVDTDGYEGREAWWAHSILLPDDFAMPTWQMYVLFDFHNTTNGAGQANFHVDFDPSGNMRFRGYGGATNSGGQYGAVIGKPEKNVWYDFVYHVKWSSASNGIMEAWVNGKKILTYSGATLYAGQGVYLKLANYHTPVCDPYPACIGTHPPSSVIHDRIVRGPTALSVAPGPLEGVLTLVNGLLVASAP